MLFIGGGKREKKAGERSGYERSRLAAQVYINPGWSDMTATRRNVKEDIWAVRGNTHRDDPEEAWAVRTGLDNVFH